MTDGFTAAAWEHWESHPDRLTATPSMAYGIAAEWARTYLAAQEATDAETSAAARAVNWEGWTCNGGTHEPGNYDECVDCQHVALDVARAALSSARAVGRDAR